MTVRTEGFAELERALQELGREATQKASLRRAARKAIQPVADMARTLAPDDPETGGNDLRSSIGVGTRLSQRQASLHRRMFRDERAAVEVFAGAGPLPQAHLQEFGTRHHAAQPFLRPAWDAEGRRTLDRLATELWADIQRTAARQARRAARQAARG
jgi:HK97 gp10 family phage protein